MLSVLVSVFIGIVYATPLDDAEKMIRTKKDAEGRELISKYLTKNDSAQSYLDVGTLFVRLKMWTDAIHYLEIATTREEKNFSAWYRLGISYHQNKQIDQAVEAFRKAEKLDKKSDFATIALGSVLELSRNRLDARNTYLAATKKKGVSSFLSQRLCVLYFQDFYFKNASKLCQQAIAKNPKDPLPPTLLARAYYDNNEKQKAFALLAETAKKFPNADLPFKARGLIYFSENTFEQAAADLGKAVGLNGSDEESASHLARSLFFLKRYEAALYAYKLTGMLNRNIRFEILAKGREVERAGFPELAKRFQNASDALD